MLYNLKCINQLRVDYSFCEIVYWHIKDDEVGSILWWCGKYQTCVANGPSLHYEMFCIILTRLRYAIPNLEGHNVSFGIWNRAQCHDTKHF